MGLSQDIKSVFVKPYIKSHFLDTLQHCLVCVEQCYLEDALVAVCFVFPDM